MICYPPLRGCKGGGWERCSVHVSLKIKRTFEFHVHSGSSSFTTFCMLGKKSQFRTIKSTRFLLKSWQITAVYCLVLLSRSLLTRKKTAISRFTPNKYHYSRLTKIPCNPFSLVRTDLCKISPIFEPVLRSSAICFTLILRSRCISFTC